jgi:hypothetical protein
LGQEAFIPVSKPFVRPPAAIANTAGDTEITFSQRFGDGATEPRGPPTCARRCVRRWASTATSTASAASGSDWSYEVSYVLGRTTLDAITNGLISREALFNGLRVEQPRALRRAPSAAPAQPRGAGCIPITL